MELRFAVVEDRLPDAQRLESLLRLAFGGGQPLVCDHYESGDAFLAAFPSKNYQVVFLDICMEGTNGIETARILRRTDPDLLLVFVTSSPEYVWDAFPVHPFDYLLKPYREEKLFQLADELRRVYRPGGQRAFDVDFMETVFERPFRLEAVAERDFPAASSSPRKLGGHLNGCRIGFDAGGSDRKVSAVIDGQTVYSEEVVWHPKTHADPEYHYQGVLSAFRAAAVKLPRVDAIGVSSAGVFLGNAPMVSSLFIKVPPERRAEVKTIYDRAAAAMGNVPLVVANDGDVTALAGAMSLHTGRIMGLAMGTSEAVGYVDGAGCVSGWFNELAFAPVDLNDHAARDAWSGDSGVGSQYFSQDAVIRLAAAAGIPLDEGLTPAEKLAAVQQRAERGEEPTLTVFRDIGVYLGHTLPLYAAVYDLQNLLVLAFDAGNGRRRLRRYGRLWGKAMSFISGRLRDAV